MTDRMKSEDLVCNRSRASLTNILFCKMCSQYCRVGVITNLKAEVLFTVFTFRYIPIMLLKQIFWKNAPKIMRLLDFIERFCPIKRLLECDSPSTINTFLTLNGFTRLCCKLKPVCNFFITPPPAFSFNN